MAKKQEKGGRFLVSHALCFWHNTFKDCAPDDKAVAARSAFFFGQLLTQHLFPVLKLPDFLLPVLNLGLQLLTGFLSRFRHGCRSFLLISIEKGQSIFSAALVKQKTYLLCKKVLFGYFFIRSMACLGVGHISLSFRQSLCYDSVHITSIFPQTQRQCYRRTDKPQPLQYHHLLGNFLLVLPKN